MPWFSLERLENSWSALERLGVFSALKCLVPKSSLERLGVLWSALERLRIFSALEFLEAQGSDRRKASSFIWPWPHPARRERFVCEPQLGV